MYFSIKNILNRNHHHNLKHTLNFIINCVKQLYYKAKWKVISRHYTLSIEKSVFQHSNKPIELIYLLWMWHGYDWDLFIGYK
jgi:hypothetical protein